MPWRASLPSHNDRFRYSPHLLELKVLDIPGRKTYRRSKLYFLRDVQPK